MLAKQAEAQAVAHITQQQAQPHQPVKETTAVQDLILLAIT
jgi:hypothetical protein